MSRLQWESLSADCMLPSSTAALSAGLKKLACKPLARQASKEFRRGMSTEDQLFALRHFIDWSRFQKQPLFTAFVDLRKAYDSVHHPLLWAPLRRKGVHGRMLAAIQSFV